MFARKVAFLLSLVVAIVVIVSCATSEIANITGRVFVIVCNFAAVIHTIPKPNAENQYIADYLCGGIDAPCAAPYQSR